MSEDEMLDSIKYVVNNSEHVFINSSEIDNFVKNYKYAHFSRYKNFYPNLSASFHEEDLLDFLFLAASQAFCFWGVGSKWTIKFKDQKLDGWWALIASFRKAWEKNVPILDGKYLSTMTLEDTKELFEGKPMIPLLIERHRILVQIGRQLTIKYQGRFHNLFINTNRESFNLLEKITQEFYGFNDVILYKGRKIFFYKKAQFIISEIATVFEEKGFGKIKNIDKLIGHADYKIPAVLRKLGILEYDKKLARQIDNRIELKFSSPEEIEIRANMLFVTYLLSRRLKLKYPEITRVRLNEILWKISQLKKKNDKPYHLTKTIYY